MELLFECKSIARRRRAVYESVWYNMMPSQCRTLLLVIVRSQKRLTIAAGRVMDLSLKGFTGVRSILIHTKYCSWILNASRMNIKMTVHTIYKVNGLRRYAHIRYNTYNEKCLSVYKS
ncbi:uncharacterized protein LOC112459433 [Temnothorax curvispinosus]|uniref:Uncharacterized protein LOC112459433 n=1 Tax=Temnothorax curvispinosus TaxID=300111 RepID=A0A6J1QAF2_9HYME|nr:uncharacterized protein LOC112459433 [Temnothorax curvispinosus]